MGFYCLTMIEIVFELASQQPNESDAFEKLAVQFLEQFTHILKAMNKIGGCEDQQIWDKEDGFYYDFLK